MQRCGGLDELGTVTNRSNHVIARREHLDDVRAKRFVIIGQQDCHSAHFLPDFSCLIFVRIQGNLRYVGIDTLVLG